MHSIVCTRHWPVLRQRPLVDNPHPERTKGARSVKVQDHREPQNQLSTPATAAGCAAPKQLRQRTAWWRAGAPWLVGGLLSGLLLSGLGLGSALARAQD